MAGTNQSAPSQGERITICNAIIRLHAKACKVNQSICFGDLTPLSWQIVNIMRQKPTRSPTEQTSAISFPSLILQGFLGHNCD